MKIIVCIDSIGGREREREKGGEKEKEKEKERKEKRRQSRVSPVSRRSKLSKRMGSEFFVQFR